MASRARSIRRFSASTERATPPVKQRDDARRAEPACRVTIWPHPATGCRDWSTMAGMGSFIPSPRATARVPDLVPVLSRGRHRSPRKGACFMELASFMAGERWSDHPACTHPLLAALARQVNDATRDGARHLLAPLIPDVVGLT